MYAALPDGGRIAYDLAGEGPPLLLIRPLGGSRVSWDSFATLLAMHTRVISFDPRGVGDSSSAPLLCSTRGMAHDVQALLDQLQVARAHVYGISLGGMVASWLAIDAPDRVQKLVLASTLPRGLEAHAPGGALGPWPMLRCLARPAGEAEACLATHILSPQFRSSQPEAVRRVQQLARQKPATHRAFLSLAGAAASHDARRQLSTIRAETLVLIGEYDPLLTIDSQRELLRELPRARYELIEGAGHDVSVEAPAKTAARVLAHLL